MANIDADAVLAVYYNSAGEALQQERMTDEIRGSREIVAVDIPERSVGDDETGSCPGTQWACLKRGGVWGCCG